ncbi:MAG: GNAT family N-acetyltransferase [Bacteroidota bacterium]
MTNTLRLVQATASDIPVIRNIAMATWPATYGDIISAKQIEYMLNMMYSETVLLEQMQAGGQQFIIAYQDEKPIAFTGFGEIKKEPLTYKLHKLYVLPIIQKSGAGKRLLREVETIAKTAGAVQLILSVNRANNAKDFYLRQGFTVLEDMDFDIGQGFLMVDHVMGKGLVD